MKKVLLDAARRSVPTPARRLLRAGFADAVKVARRTWRPARWGNLRRSPFSPVYGLDRGISIDRKLIGQFMAEHSDDIRGHVLEVGTADYAMTGGHAVAQVDILDINGTNPAANVLADLNRPSALPRERYDCFILTQTLQYIGDIPAALQNAVSTLVPGGVLLVSVPCVARLDPTAGATNDLWRFTPAGLHRLMASEAGDVLVEARGNAFLAAAFIAGAAAEELRPSDFRRDDLDHPLVVFARFVKRRQGDR